jgi:hypothetical protein
VAQNDFLAFSIFSVFDFQRFGFEEHRVFAVNKFVVETMRITIAFKISNARKVLSEFLRSIQYLGINE